MVNPKVTAAALGCAAAQVLAWAFTASTGVDVPPGVEGAFSVLLTFAAGYLKAA